MNINVFRISNLILMERSHAAMKAMKEMGYKECGSLIPHYPGLRRVPTRYRRVLPLRVMKQCQCVVVGAAQGVFTVAIADCHDPFILEFLSRITRRAIFPVLVDPIRMRLLIQRLERKERYLGKLGSAPFIHPHQAHTILILIIWQFEKQG
jgi:hypothetical protein